jgi:glucose-1-phosphate thymidylyltransferase
MKGLILAGGNGTRLRPITHTRAKQLVPIANKPIIHYAVESMVRAGIKEIGVIIGNNGADVIDSLGNGEQFGAEITYIKQSIPRGLADCVLISRDFLGEDNFIMYLGDNMIEMELSTFTETWISEGAKILLCEVENPKSFGVAQFDDSGRIVRLVEKPEYPPSNMALVGVYMFTPDIHEAVAAIKPSARGELEITDAIQWLLDAGKPVFHEVLLGWWIDTGKKDSLLECNRLVLDTIERSIDGDIDLMTILEGRISIPDGVTIINSRISGPVVIGHGTEIRDSYIGPYTAIGSNCEIINSEIENSVVMDGSEVREIRRMTDSLIGMNAKLMPSPMKPKSTRMMIGDDCVVEVAD